MNEIAQYLQIVLKVKTTPGTLCIAMGFSYADRRKVTCGLYVATFTYVGNNGNQWLSEQVKKAGIRIFCWMTGKTIREN